MPDYNKLPQWLKDYISRVEKSPNPQEAVTTEPFWKGDTSEPDTWWGGFIKGLKNEFIKPMTSVEGATQVLALPFGGEAGELPTLAKSEFASIAKQYPNLVQKLLSEKGEMSLKPFHELVKMVKGEAEFTAPTLKRIEAALKAGETGGKGWDPLTKFKDAFGDDPGAMQVFARLWGATSPNTPVARTNYETLQAWDKVLKGEIPMTNASARAADITMPGSKVPNINRAVSHQPLQSSRGEIGKTENMAQLLLGDKKAIPVDVQALSGVGASEGSVGEVYPGLREKLTDAGRKGSGKGGRFTYQDLYDQVKSIYQKGLDKFGEDVFPQMWEGVKILKGQGSSPGATAWFKKWGLMEPGAMTDPKAIEHVLQNVDRSEFYGQPERMAKQVAVPEAYQPSPKLTPEQVAELYAKDKGFALPARHEPVPLNKSFSMKVADAYDQMTHSPTDPNVSKAYEALRNEVGDQFEYLTKKGGLKVEPWKKEGQPYATSKEMMADVRTNNHLYYFPTESGFGDSVVSDHPLMQSGRSGIPANDELRIVHDYLAHALGGHSFGPIGEENAFVEHTKLLSPDAIRALASETRGQNSWVNFGKHLRDEGGGLIDKGKPGYIAPPDRPFAAQKAGLLPEDLTQPIERRKVAGYGTKRANDAARAEQEAAGVKPAYSPGGRDNVSSAAQSAFDKYMAKQGMGLPIPEGTPTVGPGPIEEMLNVTHRTTKEGLTELDPAYHGTGFVGEERSRMSDPDYLKRIYFTIEGKPVEGRFRKLKEYPTQLAKKDIYFFNEDPDNLAPMARELGGGDKDRTRTLFELLARKKGYKGVSDGTAVAWFESHKLNP